MARFTDFGNDLYTGKRSIDFVGKRRVWFAIAILLVLAALAVPLIKGRILDRQNAYLLYQHFTYREDKELVRQMLEK